MRSLSSSDNRLSTGLRVDWQVQGSVVKVEVKGCQRAPASGGLRSPVTEFSRKSRMRLIELLARLDFESGHELPKFMTLTTLTMYHPRVMKKFLKEFLRRMKRAWPSASAVWRMDFQERGAVHFHFIWLGLPYFPIEELRAMWAAIVDEECPQVDIGVIRTKRGVMFYASKYVAKVSDHELDLTLFNYVPYWNTESDKDDGFVGRFWGVHNKANLPLGELSEGRARYGPWMAYLTRIAALEWPGAGSLGGFTLFIDDADKWVETIQMLIDSDSSS